SNGKAGVDWVASLDRVVPRLLEQWDLASEPPFENLSYNYVAPVRTAEGRRAVLKVCFTARTSSAKRRQQGCSRAAPAPAFSAQTSTQAPCSWNACNRATSCTCSTTTLRRPVPSPRSCATSVAHMPGHSRFRAP